LEQVGTHFQEPFDEDRTEEAEGGIERREPLPVSLVKKFLARFMPAIFKLVDILQG
jgi:hypothetical protein